MKRRLLLFMFALLTLVLLSLVVIPTNIILAAISDGTYEIEYEMKEADNENTSIADGFFTKPATLTVEDGIQTIELTVTSSSMIESLEVPSGPVEVISEDESEETRVVRFDVDEDLSLPVDVEMHIIVPDLYDTTHTARAVFEVDELDSVDSDEENSTVGNDNNSEKENIVNENDSNTTEEVVNEEVSESDEKSESTSTALLISLIVGGILIGIIIVFLIIKNKNSNSKKGE